jgi:hypothetical protein
VGIVAVVARVHVGAAAQLQAVHHVQQLVDGIGRGGPWQHYRHRAEPLQRRPQGGLDFEQHRVLQLDRVADHRSPGVAVQRSHARTSAFAKPMP